MTIALAIPSVGHADVPQGTQTCISCKTQPGSGPAPSSGDATSSSSGDGGDGGDSSGSYSDNSLTPEEQADVDRMNHVNGYQDPRQRDPRSQPALWLDRQARFFNAREQARELAAAARSDEIAAEAREQSSLLNVPVGTSSEGFWHGGKGVTLAGYGLSLLEPSSQAASAMRGLAGVGGATVDSVLTDDPTAILEATERAKQQVIGGRLAELGLIAASAPKSWQELGDDAVAYVNALLSKYLGSH